MKSVSDDSRGDLSASLKRSRDEEIPCGDEPAGDETRCNKRRKTASLTVRVTHDGLDLVSDARIYVVNANNTRQFVPENGQPTPVPPDTYVVRAFADWHVPAPVADNNVLVLEGQPKVVVLYLTEVRYHLHVDKNRDGQLDDDRSNLDKWHWGSAEKGGYGAIMLCNNDDDGGRRQADNADEVVNQNNDAEEIAPIEVRLHGAHVPEGWTARLAFCDGDEAHARIFASRDANAPQIAGPGQAVSAPFLLDYASQIYGIEAIHYRSHDHANRDFDGFADVLLTVTSPRMNADLTAHAGDVTYQERVRFRVAPWMMPNHLDPVHHAYVADLDERNADLRSALRQHAEVTEIPESVHRGDPWVQDCMEIGYSNLPNRGMNVVLISPRGDDLRAFPPTLLAADVGFMNASRETNGGTFDSFGNLEVTPPAPRAGYPFGRIYYCAGNGRGGIDPDVEDFLNHQRVQKPFNVDATWLQVGHVDEVLTFVRSNTEKGHALLLASPRRAYDILDSILPEQRESVIMLKGRMLKRKVEKAKGGWESVSYDAEITVDKFLRDGLAAHQCRANLQPDFLDGSGLRKYNIDECQAAVDRVQETFMDEIGIDATDIVHVPVLFLPNKLGIPLAIPLTADMVNMVVIGDKCVIPRPFGPEQGAGGVNDDLFAQALARDLKQLGNVAHFVDDWDTYHLNHGEVHCGSNVLRRPDNWPRWWEYEER